MQVRLRVVGIFFDRVIKLKAKSATVADVMQAAEDQGIESFWFKKAPGNDDTLAEVGCIKKKAFKSAVLGRPYKKGAYALWDDPDLTKPVYTTFQYYIRRDGKPFNEQKGATPFIKQKVKDGDVIIWRLLSIRSGPVKRYGKAST